MHWMNYYCWGWGMGFVWTFMVLSWILLIIGIIFLVKLLAAGGKAKEHKETALEILKKRYARGEIGREEFEEKKKDLVA